MNARLGALVLCSFVLTGQATSADVVTEWNTRAGEIAVAARMSTPSTNRMMAIVQTAVFEAVNAITRRYPSSRARLDATWRPITAIRNGDIDGNEATARDASWLPFIDTPMHPEYPCAHCIVAASLAAVLQAEVGEGPMPTLTTTSPTAPGVVRSWTRVDDLVQEVSNARIYDGVHYRTSTEVGAAMGKKIGELAATTLLR